MSLGLNELNILSSLHTYKLILKNRSWEWKVSVRLMAQQRFCIHHFGVMAWCQLGTSPPTLQISWHNKPLLLALVNWYQLHDCNLLLTLWGWVTHMCLSKHTITSSDNGLSPDRHQAIIWTNAGILLIGPLGTNFSEILIEIYTFSFKKTHLKMSSVKGQPFCLGLNVLTLALNITSNWIWMDFGGLGDLSLIQLHCIK